MHVNYLTIKKFCLESGYSPAAIYKKINNGVWCEGAEFIKAPDGRVLISVTGFNKWAENIQALGSSLNPVYKSTSCITADDAGKVSSSSPPPLT